MYTFRHKSGWVRVGLAALAFSALMHGQETEISVTRAQHQRLDVEKDIQRVAVGDGNLLSVDLLNNREMLLLGKNSGRTSLLVWFTDGSFQEYLVTIHRDLSLLQSALTLIYPGIKAEIATDRDAIVLTGTVPDITYLRAAESAAHNYLDATPINGRVLLRDDQATTQPAQTPGQPANQPNAQPPAPQTGQPSDSAIRLPGTIQSSGTVINLIRVENLPPVPEEKILSAIRGIGGAGVTIRRVVKGQVRDDALDSLVLEGKVPNQVALTRVLMIAAQILTGQAVAGQQAIQVVADESGALATGVGGVGGGGGGATGGGGGGATTGGIGGGGGSLNNQVRRNIARAKVLQAAGGRILSFIQVADIPEVRIDIQLLEVDKTKLLNLNPNVGALLGTPKLGPLNPSGVSQTLQGSSTGTATTTVPAQNLVGPGTSIQGILGFLNGTLTTGAQLTAGKFGLSAILNYLQQQGVARSLASPSLTVLSGESAQFQVGGDIPVSQTTTNGTSLTVFSSVQFINYGIQLNVRPLVGDDDVLTIDVAPTISTPDTTLTSSIQSSTGTNQQTIAFQSRSLFTSARLQDGQALLVGGLLSRNTNDTTSSTPGLQNVPGLGWLFKGQNRTDDATELVVVVNPAIVRDLLPNVGLWEYPSSAELVENFARGAMNFKEKEKGSLPAGSSPGKP